MRSALFLSAAALALATVASAQPGPGARPANMGVRGPMVTPATKAVAVLWPVSGGKVHGTVTFEQTDEGVKILADVTGLTPGKHGFHIHAYGDCSAADFTSAGSHFMLAGETHGAPGDPQSHLGDLGNLEADASGAAHYEWVDPRISLRGPNSILGRGLIVHSGADDLKTQPTGDAGGRVACGVIGVAQG